MVQMTPEVSSQAGRPDGIAVRATGMHKHFGDKVAVDNAHLELRRGEIHALLGENGAGKSTLISMLCGQYRPDSGQIEVDGVVRTFNNPKDALLAGIGVVHQDFRLVPPFTVLENVVLGTSEPANRAARSRCEEILDQLGFNLDLSSRVSDLPVGQQQQTEIMKLLFRGLDILILDEPTAVLTPQQADQLFAALRRLADDGKAVAFVSHRLGEVAAAADHLTVLRHGQVVAERPAAGIQPLEIARLMVGDLGDEAPAPRATTVGPPVLELMDVSTEGTARDSLNKLSLTVCEGELVGVAGVSGNGQRHLAEVAAGMTAITTGRRNCGHAAPGFIPEDRLNTGLVGTMSVARNLAMRDFRQRGWRQRAWISAKQLEADAQPLIDEFRIPVAKPSVLVGGLSGGGQQRVIIARELSRAPKVLVASQPTRGLDVASARAVHRRLLQARDAGSGVLVISEDLDELLTLADRIVVMVHGRVVADLPRDEASTTRLGEAMTGATPAAPEGRQP